MGAFLMGAFLMGACPYRLPSTVAAMKIGGAGIDALIQALSADEDRIRLTAIVALQNAGTAGRPAIPELEKRWSKEDPAIRSQIDIAISNLRRQRDRS